MIDNLGFHDHPDLHEELAALRRKHAMLLARVNQDLFSSYEERFNCTGQLNHLPVLIQELTRKVHMEDQRIARLANAIQFMDDPILGFIGYVVWGPKGIGLDPLYEVRIIDERGWTVPRMIRTNLPASRVNRNRLQMIKDAAYYSRWNGRSGKYRAEVTAF